jgi:alpha-N-acetylglucosamine transferase
MESMPLINEILPQRVRIAIACALLVETAIITGLRTPFSSLPFQFDHLVHYNKSTDLLHGCIGCPATSSVHWSDFAYAQYVTNPSDLCNSLMVLEALRRHGTKADLLMLYPRGWELPAGNGSDSTYESKLLVQARDSYRTILSPIQVKNFKNEDDPTWQDSYTKLFAWNQTQYKRIISLSSDSTILNVSVL